jgi:hypothetical protein
VDLVDLDGIEEDFTAVASPEVPDAFDMGDFDNSDMEEESEEERKEAMAKSDEFVQEVTLKRKPEKRKHAIAVLDFAGEQAGWIPREMADILSPAALLYGKVT